MMQNVYISSTIYSFRTKPSLFNDYSYLLNERFDRNPICTSLISRPTSCCCDCCAFLTPRVPITPCYLYGLRHSGYRRLRLGVRDRVCDPGPVCYELSCSVQERRSYGRSVRGKGRCGCVEEESEVCDSGGFGELEAVLSLLSEEVGEECFGRERNGFKRVENRKSWGGSQRNVSSAKRVEEEDRRSLGGSRRNVGSVKRVEEESRGSRTSERRVEAKRGSFVGREKGERSVKGGERIESVSKGVQVDFEENGGIECRSGERRCGDRYSYLESDTKQHLDSTRVELSEKDSRQKEETRVLLRGENQRGRKGGSSSSSYYSLSSGEYGNEADVLDKNGLLEEPGSSVYKDSHYDRGRFDGRVSEEYMYRRDDAEAKSEVSRQKNTAVEGGAMWDWRKKSEKKLTEEVTEETHATKKSSEMHSGVVKTNESELAKESWSHKQFDDERENSYLIQGRKEQYSQTRNQDVVKTESRRRFQEGKETLEVHRTDAETESQSQKRLSDREQNLAMATNVVQETRDEHYKRTGHITQKEELNIDIQKRTRVSEVQVVDTERITNWQRQSDTRTNQEENTNMGLISVETEEQLHQLAHQVDQNAIQRVQSRKGTNNVAELSSVHESNTARNTNSQRTSDKRSSNQESVTVLSSTSVQETMHRKEAQSSTKASTFPGKGSEESSSVQASLSMVSQARLQREDVEGHKRSPQTPLLPPPPQLIARGSAQIGLSSEAASQEVSEETSLRNSALNYESSAGNGNTETPAKILYPTREDALDSAQRLDESSSQFVGEFFEKIRYGVSTSENQAVHEASTSEEYEAKWVPGGEKHGQRTSTQLVSEDSRLKRNESRRSSGGSGTKGPSVEMWEDMTETSTLKSPEEEKAEATITNEKAEATTASEKSEATTRSEKLESTTTSGNAVAKRTGRSIWNVVADLVKLRWNSQAETPRPASRLGERNASNESEKSEAWFSGRETEDFSEKNVKQEKGMQPETTSDQLQSVKSFSRSEKASGSVKSKDQVRYVETGMTSSPDKEESVLASQSVSLSSSEETLSPKDYQKNSRGSSSGTQIVRSSESQISTGVKSPVVLQRNKEVLKDRSDDESDNVQMGGQLIQRKLQRNKQVPKDRFDEWEEAQNREIEQRKTDEIFMREALLEAKKAADTWEVPVGAVLVQHGKIIARGHNLVEELRDSTAHAEMICIREASNVLRTWRLAESTLYVTLEPCPMCAGAILQARVDTVVWGAPNKLLGADGSWIRIFPDGGQGNEPGQSEKPAAPVHPFHPNMTIRRGVLAAECADTMQQFFYLRRKNKEKRQATSPAPPSTRAVSHHPRKLLTKLHDIFNIMFCL